MDKPIGGYFGWEFPESDGHFPQDHGLLVNSGHHGLQYILQQLQPVKKVYISYFTCDSVLTPLKVLNIPYQFYHINEQLEIAESISLSEGEYLIYTNYYGIKDAYAASLFNVYGSHLIIDNAQALFAKPVEGCYQFYSPRKFVACPDGGMVVPNVGDASALEQSKSYDKCLSLLQRADGDIPAGHASFKAVSRQLAEDELMLMSQLTESLLRSKDYAKVQQVRKANFNYLHSNLQDKNRLSSLLDAQMQQTFECPLIYPFYAEDPSLRQKLIAEKIFLAQYWPNVLEWCSPGETEYELTTHVIAIPVDQRYGREDMDRIIKIITSWK